MENRRLWRQRLGVIGGLSFLAVSVYEFLTVDQQAWVGKDQVFLRGLLAGFIPTWTIFTWYYEVREIPRRLGRAPAV